MRSTPPHKRVPNIAFDCNSLMFVWFTVALAYLSISRPFGKEGHHALIHSMPLSSRWPVEWCPWLLCVPQVVSQAPQHFRASKMQTTYDGVPPPPISLSAQSFFFTPGISRAVHPQHVSTVSRAVHPQSFRRWMSNIPSSGIQPFHFSLSVASSLNLWEWWWCAHTHIAWWHTSYTDGQAVLPTRLMEYLQAAHNRLHTHTNTLTGG